MTVRRSPAALDAAIAVAALLTVAVGLASLLMIKLKFGDFLFL